MDACTLVYLTFHQFMSNFSFDVELEAPVLNIR